MSMRAQVIELIVLHAIAAALAFMCGVWWLFI
jgi:hypothetical protein